MPKSGDSERSMGIRGTGVNPLFSLQREGGGFKVNSRKINRYISGMVPAERNAA